VQDRRRRAHADKKWQYITRCIETYNKTAVSIAQRIHKFAILPSDLSILVGTATVKLERDVVVQKDADVIEGNAQGGPATGMMRHSSGNARVMSPVRLPSCIAADGSALCLHGSVKANGTPSRRRFCAGAPSFFRIACD